MAEPRVELVKHCERLMADGQQVTARIEQLLHGPSMEGRPFDRKLARLRGEQDEIHRQLEQAMDELRTLEAKGEPTVS